MNLFRLDIDKFTVRQLKEFLKGKGHASTGNKAELNWLAKFYIDEGESEENVLLEDEVQKVLEDKRKIFDDPQLKWSDVTSTKITIPKEFSLKTIQTFLVESPLLLHEDELIPSGTVKPPVKGRKLYSSYKFLDCSVAITKDKELLFKANCGASMRNETRNPCVALSSTGDILITRCCCPQQQDGRCSHVAGTLYLIEDLSYNVPPRFYVSCTSQRQSWGQGNKKHKDSQPIQSVNYNKKKFRGDDLQNFDPRPVSLNDEEVVISNLDVVDDMVWWGWGF